MEERERQIRLRLKNDFIHYADRCLKIRSKSGEIVPFSLNQAQIHAHTIIENQKIATGKVRVIILKGRQQGISTLVEGRIYWLVSHRKGRKAFILTHDSEATDNLFEMSQRYHEGCPALVKPQTGASSAKELSFGELDSGYKVGTAGNKGVGRSSTIQYFHGSEVAFWPNAAEHAKGILQAVPDQPDTEVYLESTANGIGNYFHEQWQLAEAGQSDFIPIFLPWFWQNEYKRELLEDFDALDDEIELIELYNLNAHQLIWRRYKIQELSAAGGDGKRAFQQEYPCNATEAFLLSGEDTFIQPELVMRARKQECEAIGKLIIGVDPARFGDDRTSIIYRRGRKSYNLKSHTKKNTMEVAGIVHKIIKTDNPDYVCVDVGGLGAGVVDRLFELGCENVVLPINSGESPLDAELYVNKRSEMWGLCKKWFENFPVELPDVDSLHADICATKYSYDSLNRLVMEPKEKMKKRGLRSPDEADALCLTFAAPFESMSASKRTSEEVARKIMSSHNRLAKLRTS